MFEPQNEQGVVVRFSQEASMHGWSVVEISATFPDAILEKDGVKWRTEFEYEASSFLAHRHDHRDADLIVCWLNDYTDCPLPIIELGDPDWHALELIAATSDQKEVEYWRQRCLRAERQLARRDGGEPSQQRKPGRKPRANGWFTPEERQAQIRDEEITDARTVADRFRVSIRTAQNDMLAVRNAMMQTNGVQHAQ